MTLTPEIRWIDTPEALDAACAEVAQAEVIALDTEFFREKTFHPVPALIQFSVGGPVWLVDPLTVGCTESFRQLLGEGPLKLLHASSEDLEVLAHWAGVTVAPLVDTQVAQALLGEDAAMGYQRLVQHWTGETLPKDETRSDWLQRPLSDSQRLYAALDVVFLLEVWKYQREALEQQGRREWLEADCRELLAQALRSDAADEQWYRRHRQLWRLAPRQIEAYRLLTTWREGEARRRNLPRGWLFSDRVLYGIAERMPENRYQLAEIEDIKPSQIKRDGDTLLALVKQAHQCEEAALPPVQPSPLGADYKRRMKALKRVVNERAETLGLAPEVLMRRRDLEAMIAADLAAEPLPLPQGWRGECLSAPLAQALDEVKAE
ncbi:ribonuclease D [Billgrantia diversa]|uniref:ribonuclease D n=1 Tax=Halomonas sp. MCCC 1A13316 TaxID=2733487 RepID=UPI0018A5CCC0|nr:ribonuclease D [Halomonas sp. MCCC 1A13316]QOR38357.1 ribonuclease D [Halomonas sp. MCCC 1A13316]